MIGFQSSKVPPRRADGMDERSDVNSIFHYLYPPKKKVFNQNASEVPPRRADGMDERSDVNFYIVFLRGNRNLFH